MTVHLTTGRAITGKLAVDDEAQVVLVVPQGKLTFPRKLVASIEREAPGRFALSEALEHALAGRHEAAEAAFARALDDPGSAAAARDAYARYSARLEQDLAAGFGALTAGSPVPGAPAGAASAQPAGTAAAGSAGPVLVPLRMIGALERLPQGWPPGQVAWETDPAQAFARARRERRAVLLYYGNLGCPHCVAITRDVWSRPEVAAAARQVVPLALFHGEGQLWDWQVLLDLRCYPRVAWLDGWGRRLPQAGEPREPGAMQRAIGEAARLARGVSAPDRATPPAALVRRLPAAARTAATDPSRMLRSRAWRGALGGFAGRDLSALYTWAQADDDAALRRAILLALDDAPAAIRDPLLLVGLGDANTWVRRAALAAGARLQARALLPAAREQALAVVRGQETGVLALPGLDDLLTFLGDVPDATTLPLLRQVLERYDWHYTVSLRALQVTGRIHASDPARCGPGARAALRAAFQHPEVLTGSYAPWQRRIYEELVRAAWQVLDQAPPSGTLEAQLAQTHGALR